MTRFARLIAAVSLMLCGSLANAEDEPEEVVREFGAPIQLETQTTLSQIVANPERYVSGPVLIRGRITDVCQKKGCWTVLADGDAHLRIRFKDYGFFVPKDSRGKFALAEGLVRVETQSQKTARHYASESIDGDPKAIVGPQKVVEFTATGVRLIDSGL